jgi:hypothetical protein
VVALIYVLTRGHQTFYCTREWKDEQVENEASYCFRKIRLDVKIFLRLFNHRYASKLKASLPTASTLQLQDTTWQGIEIESLR